MINGQARLEGAESDDRLLAQARRGDRGAFAALYLRHRAAAQFVARMWTASPADADDAVADGFARVLAALPGMTRDDIAFRPYLLACVRNAARDRTRRERRIDLRETTSELPAGDQAEEGAFHGLEQDLLAEALGGLPHRWRTVLWLTEVEGLSPGLAARQLGLSPNAVSALAYRARKRLRQSYLQAHLSHHPAESCRAAVSQLARYVRDGLEGQDRDEVHTHLEDCEACRMRWSELADLNATIRHALAPVAGILAQAAPVSPATSSPVAGKAVAAVAAGIIALSGVWQANREPEGPPPARPEAAATVQPEGGGPSRLAAASSTGLPGGLLGPLRPGGPTIGLPGGLLGLLGPVGPSTGLPGGLLGPGGQALLLPGSWSPAEPAGIAGSLEVVSSLTVAGPLATPEVPSPVAPALAGSARAPAARKARVPAVLSGGPRRHFLPAVPLTLPASILSAGRGR